MNKIHKLLFLLLFLPFFLKAIPIHEIQYVPNPTVNDSSLYVGQTVTINGIVSFAYQSGGSSPKEYCFVQDSSGAWNGILVFIGYVSDKGRATIEMGDSVTITGEVIEYYGVTEIGGFPEITTHNKGLKPHAAYCTSTNAVNDEKYEGVLVEIRNAVTLNSSSNSCEFDDGSGPIKFYDKCDNIGTFPSNGDTVLQAIGVCDYYSTDDIYEVYPRGNFDIVTSVNGTGKVILTPDTVSIDDTLDIDFAFYPSVDTVFGIIGFTQIYISSSIGWDSSSSDIVLTGDLQNASFSINQLPSGAHYLNFSNFQLVDQGNITIRNIRTPSTPGDQSLFIKTGTDSLSSLYMSDYPKLTVSTSSGSGKAMINPYFLASGINKFKIILTPNLDTALFTVGYTQLTIPSNLSWSGLYDDISVSAGVLSISGNGSDTMPYILECKHIDLVDTFCLRIRNIDVDSTVYSINFNIETGIDSSIHSLCGDQNIALVQNYLFDSLITIWEAQKPGEDGYSSGMYKETVKIRGFVTGPSASFNPTESTTSFYIQDSTAGINVFTGEEDASERFTLGKEVIVKGIIDEYNGLTEIIYDDINNITIISDSGAYITPEILPLSSGLNERNEGKLFKVEKCVLGSTPYLAGTGYNMQVWNGQSVIDIRINNSTGIPDDTIFANLKNGDYVSITGIEGQYDSSEPYSSGYQLMPRFLSDLSLITPPDTTDQMNISLYPNPFRPDNGEMLNIDIIGTTGGKFDLKVYDLKGRLVKTFGTNMASGNISFWWNGRNDHDSYLNIGPYIIVYTLKMPNGTRKRIKKAIVIGTQLK